MSPGDVMPVVLGVTLPSGVFWMILFPCLYILLTLVELAFWAYWNELGDAQFADPATREGMNLAARPGIFGSRMRPAAERLAEPARSRALWWCDALGVSFWVLTAIAVLVLGSYFLFVSPPAG